METINFNNISVKYRDHTISIAQHKKGNEEIYIEEIMVFGDHVCDEVIRFSGLTTLIDALDRAKGIIDTMTEGGMKLTETDVRVLRTLNGQEGGIAGWGAAVSASIGWLRGAGYAQGYSKIEITDAGRAALQAQEKKDD